MAFSKKGKPCMALMASAADLTSAKTTHACPLSLYVFRATMSRILPNWEKMAYRLFLRSGQDHRT